MSEVRVHGEALIELAIAIEEFLADPGEAVEADLRPKMESLAAFARSTAEAGNELVFISTTAPGGKAE